VTRDQLNGTPPKLRINTLIEVHQKHGNCSSQIPPHGLLPTGDLECGLQLSIYSHLFSAVVEREPQSPFRIQCTDPSFMHGDVSRSCIRRIPEGLLSMPSPLSKVEALDRTLFSISMNRPDTGPSTSAICCPEPASILKLLCNVFSECLRKAFHLRNVRSQVSDTAYIPF
jgi:hypothetical protein